MREDANGANRRRAPQPKGNKMGGDVDRVRRAGDGYSHRPFFFYFFLGYVVASGLRFTVFYDPCRSAIASCSSVRNVHGIPQITTVELGHVFDSLGDFK